MVLTQGLPDVAVVLTQGFPLRSYRLLLKAILEGKGPQASSHRRLHPHWCQHVIATPFEPVFVTGTENKSVFSGDEALQAGSSQVHLWDVLPGS